METEVESQGTPETEASVEVEGTAPETSTEATPQGNPFWKEVEDKLGPNNFAVIEPYLKNADAEYQKGITSANERLKPFKGFIDQGIQPEVLTQAMNLAVTIRDTPEVVYEHLGKFLEENGRLPSTEELKQEIADSEDPESEEDPRDKQLRELLERQEQTQNYLQAQEQERVQAAANAEADNWVTSELDRIQKAHPTYGKEDIQEILRIAAFQTQQSGQVQENFDAAVAQYEGLRGRLLSTRPGAAAPRVPGGAGGGTPGTGTVNPAQMSSADRQALVASMLSGNK